MFVVGRTHDHEVVARSLRFYKMGSGPDYLFFRPYTLAEFEMPETIADVWINGHALATPPGPPVADVVTMAKRDLQAGETLDGIGGYTCYGAVDTRAAAGCSRSPWHEGAVLRTLCHADAPVPLDAVEIDESSEIAALRRRQDAAGRRRSPIRGLRRPPTSRGGQPSLVSPRREPRQSVETGRSAEVNRCSRSRSSRSRLPLRASHAGVNVGNVRASREKSTRYQRGSGPVSPVTTTRLPSTTDANDLGQLQHSVVRGGEANVEDGVVDDLPRRDEDFGDN